MGNLYSINKLILLYNGNKSGVVIIVDEQEKIEGILTKIDLLDFLSSQTE